MPSKNNLANSSIALLTWKSPATLEKTLKSLDVIASDFGDKLVICQEGSEDELSLARRYGYRAIPTVQNLGILGGLKKAVLEAEHNAVLLLENDANFIGSENDRTLLSDIAGHLIDDTIQYCCLMERLNGPTSRYLKYWSHQWPPKKRFLSYLRPHIARSLKAESLNFRPDSVTSSDFATLLGENLWKTDSRYFRWSNRAKFLQKSFFLDKLVLFAEENPTDRTVNGLMDLEHQINAPKQRNWYTKQKFPLAIHTQGLFGHERYDRPDGDEKWKTGLPVIENSN